MRSNAPVGGKGLGEVMLSWGFFLTAAAFSGMGRRRRRLLRRGKVTSLGKGFVLGNG